MRHLIAPSRTAKALALLDSQAGMTPYAAAKQAGVDVAAVYRALKRKAAAKAQPTCPCCGRVIKEK